MSFSGFSKEDFLAFPKGSRGRKLEVKQKLYNLIELVSEKLENYAPELHKQLMYKGVGNLRKDAGNCWGYLSKAKSQSNSVHFNFIVNDEGLSVGVQLERPWPIRSLISNINEDMSGFLKTLRSLEENIIVDIHKRIPILGKNGEPLPRRFKWERLCRFQSKFFDRYALDYLLNELERLEYSAISFHWQYYWTYDMDLLSSGDIIDDVAREIEHLLPIYAFARR
ncbi:MAG: hypothetical protein E3J73_03935 [Candidatus Bathyarchaeum sp.]|nr:MAG: hypothetical protein E3J73_03935 [Candidatus Bathyarchaeum sp.]